MIEEERGAGCQTHGPFHVCGHTTETCPDLITSTDEKVTHKLRVQKWKKNSKDESYTFTRYEGAPNQTTSIEEHHGEKFIPLITEKIDQLRKQGNPRKVRILDVGGGACIYADQLRRTFPNDIKVYTTGLSKKQANFIRNRIHDRQKNEQTDISTNVSPFSKRENIPWQVEPKISKDDLKWRSITQLEKYPEFDFILDTSGEALHGTWDKDPAVKKKLTEDYYHALISKLQPGGYASIAPNIFGAESSEFKIIQEMAEEMGAEVEIMRWQKEIPGELGTDNKPFIETYEALKIKKLPQS